MSTSRIQAENDLLSQLPSCSYPLPLSTRDFSPDSPVLCDDVLIEVFRRAARSSNLKEQLRLRRICALANAVVGREMERNDELIVEIKEPSEFRYIGLRREKLSVPEPNIVVQGVSTTSATAAVALVQSALGSMSVLRRLSLFSCDPDPTVFELILEQLLGKENVRLESLHLRRRRGGAVMANVVQLVKENASSLKKIGQIGLSEAAQCFSIEMRLSRLHLHSFDLGFGSDPTSVCQHMIAVGASGATTEHLSYSSFEGFDPTDIVVQNFLTALDCTSLRLTMMRGAYVPPQPDYRVGKVRRVEHVEMVEVVEKTNIFNTLVTYEKILKKVFPNVEDINYSQDWKN